MSEIQVAKKNNIQSGICEEVTFELDLKGRWRQAWDNFRKVSRRQREQRMS